MNPDNMIMRVKVALYVVAILFFGGIITVKYFEYKEESRKEQSNLWPPDMVPHPMPPEVPNTPPKPGDPPNV